MRRILLLLLALALAAAPAHAQRRGETPRRPNLPAAADSNDARAYLDVATRLMGQGSAREAADAFYWAFQLDPTSSDALYGRYTALLMSNPQRLVDYWNGERRVVRSRDVMAIDSLYFRALTMNPFLYRRYETPMFTLYLRTMARSELNRQEGGMAVPESAINEWINYLLQNGGPWLRAEEAYGEGRFQDALEFYNQAVARARNKSRVRAERARLFAHVGNNEAAIQEFATAIEEMRRDDERELVFLYESKALLEHSVGMLHERAGNRDAAREAYGRAVTEDLAFYPAHVRLGLLALAAGDTTAAVSELDLAVQAGGADAHILYTYGAVLAQLGRMDEATAQLQRAMAAAPHWAEPHFVLGVVRDAQGNLAGAREAYQAFLARAPAGHRRRGQATQRVVDLEGATATAAAPAPEGR